MFCNGTGKLQVKGIVDRMANTAAGTKRDSKTFCCTKTESAFRRNYTIQQQQRTRPKDQFSIPGNDTKNIFEHIQQAAGFHYFERKPPFKVCTELHKESQTYNFFMLLILMGY